MQDDDVVAKTRATDLWRYDRVHSLVNPLGGLKAFSESGQKKDGDVNVSSDERKATTEKEAELCQTMESHMRTAAHRRRKRRRKPQL